MLGSYQEGQKGGHKMLLSSHFLKHSTLAPNPGNPVRELVVQSHALIQSFMQIMFVGLSTVLQWVHVSLNTASMPASMSPLRAASTVLMVFMVLVIRHIKQLSQLGVHAMRICKHTCARRLHWEICQFGLAAVASSRSCEQAVSSTLCTVIPSGNIHHMLCVQFPWTPCSPTLGSTAIKLAA